MLWSRYVCAALGSPVGSRHMAPSRRTRFRAAPCRDALQTPLRRSLLFALAPFPLPSTRQVACELAYINTSHPQFIGGNRAIAQVGGGRCGGDGRHTGGRGPAAVCCLVRVVQQCFCGLWPDSAISSHARHLSSRPAPRCWSGAAWPAAARTRGAPAPTAATRRRRTSPNPRQRYPRAARRRRRAPAAWRRQPRRRCGGWSLNCSILKTCSLPRAAWGQVRAVRAVLRWGWAGACCGLHVVWRVHAASCVRFCGCMRMRVRACYRRRCVSFPPCFFLQAHPAPRLAPTTSVHSEGGSASAHTSPPRPGLASIPGDAAGKGSWFSNW